MTELSRELERIKKDNNILQDRAERYMRDIQKYKEYYNLLIKENLKLENEILYLRKIVNYYENRENRNSRWSR